MVALQRASHRSEAVPSTPPGGRSKSLSDLQIAVSVLSVAFVSHLKEK